MSALAWAILLSTAAVAAPAENSVPILYTTDLYHPHDDPDDHFDLATLFAMPEFDVRGIVIDMGERGSGRPAIPALEQIMHLAKRKVPYATGLRRNLTTAGDTGMEDPKAHQQGIDLILKCLRDSKVPLVLFTTGSLRDVAAAFNREPELLKDKVSRIYVNAGWVGKEIEWNVKLDPLSFVRVMNSGLPVYWVPCFGEDRFQSLWAFQQSDVLENVPGPLQNFILYALTKADPKQCDPIEYLYTDPPEESLARFWPQTRKMWCTAAFLHAAGRPMEEAAFETLTVKIGDDGQTLPAEEGHTFPTIRVRDEAAYAREMTETLRRLLAEMPIAASAEATE